jgi:eukaryotic-like serine/threonine-protein kinase
MSTAQDTTTSEKARFEIGRFIDDKWVLMERVGKGGMGEVFRAHQLNLKRDVAIKVISEEFLRDSEEHPEEISRAMARLQREVQIMAQVRHPNVLQIYDFGTVEAQGKDSLGQVQYIAMEYIPGNTLRFTMSEEGVRDEAEMLVDWIRRYYLPVLDGLEAIHANGVIHRDVKPENILMDGETPKISDFGLARSPRLKAVSNSWDVKGSMPYMAPEQFADFRKAGIAADIYSLGKILYEEITGKLDRKMVPFKGVGLANPETNFLKTMDSIIRKATDEDPRNRFQSIPELRQVIQDALEQERLEKEKSVKIIHDTPSYVRSLWIGIIAVLFAMGSMTVYHLLDHIPANQIAFKKGDVEPDKKIVSPIPLKPAATRVAADGREMQLLNDPEKHKAFYSDQTPVTFHHYVEFLNDVRDDITVNNGLVRYKENIWIYLGDGSEPSDQIVFRNSHFFLRQAKWAPQPVTRVTWLGAQAYARHYDKSLPSFEEWKTLNRQVPSMPKPKPSSQDTFKDSTNPQRMMQTADEKNGQNQDKENIGAIKEWLTVKSDGAETSSVVEWSEGDYRVTKRYPWEGFYDVGFRTVMDIK